MFHKAGPGRHAARGASVLWSVLGHRARSDRTNMILSIEVQKWCPNDS